MKTLHLIIHKSMIEDELESSSTSNEKKLRLQSVLQRINNIEIKANPHVKHILFDTDDSDILEGIHYVVDICQGYSSVVLYGISTTACLPFTKNRLKAAGFKVRYDLSGIIE